MAGFELEVFICVMGHFIFRNVGLGSTGRLHSAVVYFENLPRLVTHGGLVVILRNVP